MDTVLVMDSEVLVRSEIATYLRRCGYLVIEAGTSIEAIRVLSEQRLRIDAILIDAESGGEMNGFALGRWVRLNRQDVRVILAATIEKTAHAAADLCEEGPQVARPYQPEQVSNYIRRMLAARLRSEDET
jgi:CheY-like chemotaxis protein